MIKDEQRISFGERLAKMPPRRITRGGACYGHNNRYLTADARVALELSWRPYEQGLRLVRKS